MAKFVLTTWAACLARQNPVSTRANPACMKITRIAPMTTQSMFVVPVRAATGSSSWAKATPPVKSTIAAAPRVPPTTYLKARLLRIRPPLCR